MKRYVPKNRLLVGLAVLAIACVASLHIGMGSALASSEEAHMISNAKRVYQVFRSVGLSNQCIAGMLANLERECEIDPTSIEGVYSEPFSATGPKKSQITKSKKALSDWTITLLTASWGYHGTYNGLTNRVTGAYVGGYRVYADFWGPQRDGLFCPGIGIGSWAGEGAQDMLEVAKQTSSNWWNLEFQLAYMLKRGSSDGTGAIYSKYKNQCANKTPQECAEWFLAYWEGCPGVDLAARKTAATAWYKKITKQKWATNASYAKKIKTRANTLYRTKVKGTSTISVSTQAQEYTGGGHTYTGLVKKTGSTGSVLLHYYTDKKCTKEVSASQVVSVRTYYVRAEVVEDANYVGAWSRAAKFKIMKRTNPLTVKAKRKRVKLAKVTKRRVKVRPITVTAAAGTVTYKKVGSCPALKVSSKTGVVTVKKGTSAGTYKVGVLVKAAGDKNYRSAKKTVTIKIVVM